ncbi:MAG: 2'-5' RNA ligase family protein [Ginsengibacter sp.]
MMKTESLSSPPALKEARGQELYEYLLVVCPATGIYEKIMTEKESFYSEFKEKNIVERKPYIIVSDFLAKEAMEDTLIRWIQRICRQRQGFTVTFNNYSGFPPHTIYLRVQNERPFQKLRADLEILNTYISSCACPPMKFAPKPYLSIAGDLSEEVYFKALIQYAHKSFHESFAANELLLLKRAHEYEECKPVNVFGLQPEENPCAIYY